MDFESREKEFEERYRKVCGKNRRSTTNNETQQEEKTKKVEISKKEKEQLEKELNTAKCDLEVIRRSLGKTITKIPLTILSISILIWYILYL